MARTSGWSGWPTWPRLAEVGREVEGPDEQHVDALGAGDGGNVLDRLGAFDLAHHQELFARAFHVLGRAQAVVGAAHDGGGHVPRD